MLKEHCQEIGGKFGAVQHNGPFTYLLVHKPTGKKYYGSRYAQGCSTSELWTTYFSSSKVVQQLIAEDGKDSFVCTVRKTFSTAEEAISWEGRVLRKVNARKDPRFINMHNNDGLVGLKGDSNPMRNAEHLEKWKKSAARNKTGRILSIDHKNAISKALTGRVRSKEECDNISKGLKGISRSDTFKNMCRERQTGVIPSQENKEKKRQAIKGRKKYTNGSINIMCFPSDVPPGFVLITKKAT